MPEPWPKEFREDIVRVARNREPGATLDQIATTDEGRLPQLPVRSTSPLSPANGTAGTPA
ncbi:hypothetical protein [Streptomyces olivaceus]|uniref:hypothetical protein n=1 Tax=Streptomyces olivaceus TaxID=47716 RepID=UPI000B23A497|nr:hypothetical protein [Streptomyces olivaceus]